MALFCLKAKTNAMPMHVHIGAEVRLTTQKARIISGLLIRYI
jgi:hypothetical protein